MFDTVLVANRGEIACRIIAALKGLGIRSVAVYSDADAVAPHVLAADAAVRIGPAAAAQSYLDIAAVIGAAHASGAQAIHPGYGFLAENPDFAAACAAAGLVFIGPSPHALAVMGDKIRARAHVAARGVPVLPGTHEAGLSDGELAQRAAAIGLPLLVKPSGGGGGKGMHVAHTRADLSEALTHARREAEGAFGDGDLLLERYLASPRHIEVQVLADDAGHTIHLGERECSLQRRHQKIIEEAPSPWLTPTQREEIGAAAIEAARSVAYTGAGTVEFLASAEHPGEFFFLEMNTRLQVEHPVTEMVTGIDLVAWQLRIAAGESLTISQTDVHVGGHAIEARIYAEDPAREFLPTGGRVLALRTPQGPGIRVDSGLAPGLEVGSEYDPMLAKVIAHGTDRPAALARLDRALADLAVVGVGTNVEFLRALLAEDRVRAGDLDTGLVEALAFTPAPPDSHARAAAALLATREPEISGPRAWGTGMGWRPGGGGGLTVAFEGLEPVVLSPADLRGARLRPSPGGGAWVEFAGRTHYYDYARTGRTVHLVREGNAWEFTRIDPLERHGAAGRAEGPELRSPMPGVIAVLAAPDGELVAEGEAVVVVAAMKMEHVLRAPHAGRVELHVREGEQVGAKQLLATVAAQGEA